MRRPSKSELQRQEAAFVLSTQQPPETPEPEPEQTEGAQELNDESDDLT